jgi:hypothetical protein
VQAAPGGSLPQLDPTQAFGDAQSALLAQSVRQAAPAPHTKGSHIEVVAGRQTPAPSQLRAEVIVEPVQEAVAQVVPADHWRHPPLPSQVPSLPQVALSAAAHWLAGTGACPAVMAVHVPTLPVRLHDMQVLPQATLQQTPW